MTNRQISSGTDDSVDEHEKLDQKRPKIKLSVIIPTLNASSTLSQTLASLSTALERGIELEIIVVDANSQDDTKALAF